MKKKIYKILTAGVLVLFFQLPAYAQTVIFTEDASDEIKAVNLSNMASYSYIKADGDSHVYSKITSLKDKLFDYTSSALELSREAGGRCLFQGVNDKTAILDIDLKGSEFIFNSGMAVYSDGGETQGLPREFEAVNLAKEHLKNLGLTPGAGSLGQMELIRVGGLSMGVLDKYGITTEFKKLVTVTFGRTLSDLPVMGASRAVVKLGQNGNLAGLVINWPLLKKDVTRDSVDTVDETSLKQYVKGMIEQLTTGETDDIVINKVKLVMYDDGIRKVEPALFVLGEKITSHEKVKIHVDWILPLLKVYQADYPIFRKAPVMPDPA